MGQAMTEPEIPSIPGFNPRYPQNSAEIFRCLNEAYDEPDPTPEEAAAFRELQAIYRGASLEVKGEILRAQQRFIEKRKGRKTTKYERWCIREGIEQYDDE